MEVSSTPDGEASGSQDDGKPPGYEEEPEIKVIKKKTKQVGFTVVDEEADFNEHLVEKWTEKESPDKVKADREHKFQKTL